MLSAVALFMLSYFRCVRISNEDDHYKRTGIQLYRAVVYKGLYVDEVALVCQNTECVAASLTT